MIELHKKLALAVNLIQCIAFSDFKLLIYSIPASVARFATSLIGCVELEYSCAVRSQYKYPKHLQDMNCSCWGKVEYKTILKNESEENLKKQPQTVLLSLTNKKVSPLTVNYLKWKKKVYCSGKMPNIQEKKYV